MSKPIDISGYITNRFPDSDYRNENWRFDCPFCGADRKRFSVSIVKGVVHCWRCDYTNSLLGFVCDNESVNYSDAFRIVKKYVPVRVPKGPIRKPRTAQASSKVPGYIPITELQPESKIGQLAKGYLRKRGITDADVKFWRLGISTDKELVGRIISPFFENGVLRYYVARKFTGPGPRYKNPSLSEWGVGKSELLYNYDSALRNSDNGITIVEGVYDVYAVGKHAVGLLGKRASDVQISKILLMDPKRISISLDSDATDEAFELAARFNEIVPTTIITHEKGDPADNRISPSRKEEVRYSFRELLAKRMKKSK